MSDIPPDLLGPNPSGLMTQDEPGLPLTGPQWGIWDANGQPILTVDAVANIDYARDFHISDYPQEKGAFQSYNKVKVPFQAKVGFFISTQRSSFLNNVEKVVSLLDLVTVVTPEIQYPSANLTHYSFRREARSGVTLIRVDVWAEEVRIVGGATSSNAQSTNAASPEAGGQKQGVPTVQNPPTAHGADPESGLGPDAVPNEVGGGFKPTASVYMGTGPGDFIEPPPAGFSGTGALDASSSGLGPDSVVTSTQPTIPSGIPNGTGGGASAATTDINSTVNPAFGPGGF